MIVKVNNDEVIKADQIIREDSFIKGYIHGKKTSIFEINLLDEFKAKEAMAAITETLRNSNFVDINSIFYQFK